MTKLATLLICTLCVSFTTQAQRITNLFESRASLSRNFHSVASRYQSLSLNRSELTTLRSDAPAQLQLDLPFEGGLLQLDLHKVSLTTPEFNVIEARADGSRPVVPYNDGVFYQGKVAGIDSSMATISLTGGEVMGVIADRRGNIVLGAIEQNGVATSEYTLYRDQDLATANPAVCLTSETPVNEFRGGHTTARGQQTGQPIEIYFECDNKVYTDRGSNTNSVISFVLGFFNNVALLYSNEDIKVQVSQILVWTTPDPEVQAGLSTTNSVLTSFSTRMSTSSYQGDYAQFVSRRNLGGGVAWLLNDPCGTTRYYRTSVCAIDNSYNNFPTYSWTVEVVTHELGHNFGSNHTQWCGWVGGALDNCYQTEPAPSACAPGPQPTNGGTIMSYCHLVSTGINLANGFGQQPGDKIRSVIGAAACFATCKMIVTVANSDASCGLNNGGATVTVTGNTGGLTYEWSNGQTTSTLTNVAPGAYFVTVREPATGCQIMKDVVVGNLGSTLPLTLTPSGTAGFCAGGSLTLTATSNLAYTYAWTFNGAPVVGATTNTLVATVAGTYRVTVSAGGCSSNQSVVLSQVTAPTANITAGSSTSFCEGGQVILNANIGSSYGYQWYRGGTAIAGATGATYTASVSGSYTVKVSAGGNACEATSSAVTVTVSPSPLTTVTSSVASNSFCAGGSLLLSTSTGTNYTYQWYKSGVLITGATGATLTVTQGGSYTVTTTLGSCSKSSTPVSVTVFALPSVTVTPASSTISKFSTQTLTASGAATYDLLTQPAFISSTSNTVTVRPLTTTVYSITGTDANGCKATATATIIVAGCGDVSNFSTTVLSPSRVLVKWTNPQDVTTDTLQYRRTGETAWTSVFVTGQEYELNGLQPGTAYEYNVIPLCSTTNTFFSSPTQSLQTPALASGLYVRLFPNPVTTTARLEVISTTPFTLKATIYDQSGKMVRPLIPAGTFPAGQVIRAIDGSSLAAGVYHINVYVNGKLENVKMLVIR